MRDAVTYTTRHTKDTHRRKGAVARSANRVQFSSRSDSWSRIEIPLAMKTTEEAIRQNVQHVQRGTTDI